MLAFSSAIASRAFCVGLTAKASIAKTHQKSPISRFFAVRAVASAACQQDAPDEKKDFNIAIIGAGFAGLAVCWHLLARKIAHGRKIRPVVFDAARIGSGDGGGGSAVAGGLLHPYTPRGKLLWKGEEGFRSSMELLRVASQAIQTPVARHTGILRPARNPKQAAGLKKAALAAAATRAMARSGSESEPEPPPPSRSRSELESERASLSVERLAFHRRAGPAQDGLGFPLEDTYTDLVWLDSEECSSLAPGISCEYGGLLMQAGMSVDSRKYLEGLWAACEAQGAVHVKSDVADVEVMCEEYDAVVACTGAFTKKLGHVALASLPLTAVKGQTLEVPRDRSRDAKTDLGWPLNASENRSRDQSRDIRSLGVSLISGVYISVHRDRVDCGATKEYTFESLDPDVSAATNELLPALQALFPPFSLSPADLSPERSSASSLQGSPEGSTSSSLSAESSAEASSSVTASPRVAPDRSGEASSLAASGSTESSGDRSARVLLRSGLRGVPPRQQSGTIPICGHVDANVWCLVGLGSRGLVYHAYLASLLADAICRAADGASPNEGLPKDLLTHLDETD